jgi:hypothetical protein
MELVINLGLLCLLVLTCIVVLDSLLSSITLADNQLKFHSHIR